MSCHPEPSNHTENEAWADDAELLYALDMVDVDHELDELFVESMGSTPRSEWATSPVRADPTSPRIVASKKTSPALKSALYAKRKYPPMENRSRNNRREELEYLRCTVESLQGRLAALKQRVVVPSDGESSRDSTKSAIVGRVTETKAWREFALRQLEQRQDAEVKNKKLRKMLKDQMRLASSLEKLLSRTEDPEQIQLLAPPVPTQFRPPIESQAMFEFLEHDLAEMHASVDAIFSDARFSSAPRKMRDIQVRPDPSSSSTVVEIIESKLLPFDLHATARAVWEQSARLFSLNGSIVVHDAVDTAGPSAYLKDFSVTMPDAGSNAIFRGKIAGRRYIEQHRVIVVWSTYSEPRGVNDMEGLALRHKGWTVIQNPGSGPGETLIQSFQLAVPEATRLLADAHHRLSTFARFLLGAVDFQLTAGHQILENLLLEEMRRQRSHAAI